MKISNIKGYTMSTMKPKDYLCIIITSCCLLQISATSMCEVEDRKNDCVYTIVCDRHAGNAYNPECEFEPYVTFIMKNSNAETLTPGFFGATNFDSRVRIFKAINNSWTNIESFAFKYYGKTIEMDLSKNNIKDLRDGALLSLGPLKTLNLSNNVIEIFNPRIFTNPMSSYSTFSSHLEIIDLSNNKLNYVGNVFNKTTKLSKLLLQYNSISSISEQSLPFLSSLILHHNNLTLLNATLMDLPSLKEIDISFNYLTLISGFELNKLVSLETVNMSHNAIEYIELNSFNLAYNLRTLDLSFNKIKSTIATVMFINNRKLEYLNFYNNNITEIQDNAFAYNILSYLNFEKNNLSEIKQNTFKGINNITYLDISNQSVSALGDLAFSDASNLVYLNISKNVIHSVENTSFTNASTLKILDLSYNKIKNIHFLKDTLLNLTELNLSYNNLTIVPKSCFVSQMVMIKLDISFNNILSIEANSLPLQYLQFLNVNNNNLSGIVQKNTFSPAKYLRSLDLSHFKLRRIDKLAFENLPVITRLNLSHNIIENIEPNNFRAMNNMYSLDVSYNKLSSFNLNNTLLNNLKALYLNNNRLTNISQIPINMTNLLYLDLSNNNISSLDAPFIQFPNLMVLHLCNNNIKKFNNPQTNSVTKLTDLSISSNQLKEIKLNIFKALVKADISNNNFTSINASFFENLDYLQSFDISRNKIAEIAPGTFQQVKILKLLNMSRNNLSKLRYGIFKGLHRTEVLDVSYNRLTEIDVDVFHECTELKRLTIDYNYLKTVDVERLIVILPKLTTLSLGGNPVSCKEIVRSIKNINKNMIRQVDVTSIEKVYHEDNVHGIQCGDNNSTAPTEKPPSDSKLGSHVILNVFVLLLCIIAVAVVLIIGYLYSKKKSSHMYSDRSVRMSSNSFQFSGSDTQHDLLS